MGIPFLNRIRERYGLKLAVAFTVVILLTVGVGTVVSADASAQLRADVEQHLAGTADERAERLDAWLSGVQTQARSASDHPALRSDDRATVTAYLDELASDDRAPPGVVATHYVDADSGEIITSSNEQLVGVDARAQGAPFAQEGVSFSGPNDVLVTDPFRPSVVDFTTIAVATPVDGREDRLLVYMINFEQQVAQFDQLTEHSRTIVVDGDGTVVAHPNAELIGSSTDELSTAVPASAFEGQTFEQQGDTVTAAAPVGATDWSVVIAEPAAEAFAVQRAVVSGIVGLILVAVVSLALIGVTIGSRTTLSLRRLSGKAEAMAAGDLDVDLTTGRTDEIGQLYHAFDEMRASLRERITEAEEALAEARKARTEAEEARTEAEEARAEATATNERLERTAEAYGDVMQDVADGDLTRRIDVNDTNDAMATIGTAFNDMVSAIESTIEEVKAFGADVANAAEAVDRNATDVMAAGEAMNESVAEIADGARSQTESLQDMTGEVNDLSASAEEIAATVDTVADTSERAAEAGADGRAAAEAAVEELDGIEETTDHTQEEVEALKEEMAEIGEIVDVISDIAEQTNLLALNASIEAAHANGDAGDADGFAVVADEVKNLAEETKESASEIEARIESVRERTEQVVSGTQETSQRVTEGVETVEGAIDALERIADYVEEIDSSIQGIADATDGQADSTERVVQSLDEVAAISKQTAEQATGVTETADRQERTISEVDDAADELTQRAARLREQLADFDVGTTGADTMAGGQRADALGDGGRDTGGI
ncbi:methyl-accepting chemotaxis protein [Haloplanus aerogenes]|uniref:Methyl-accepting chemotaxis protein n=1 Tax=Haloplanus aerogenes TaxID=660522 RepID=A0A3M0DY31_9EURY|nr:methyl-accepting chemotaxis protein [Haloplanus aerogenes]AZH24236.1 methyl-accepting chemotaxis protein [Haloplanus aerogenes]RMB24136.1 methyl-accepting chemotaxis protein [Haloplanus aerogenes]